MEAAAIQPDTTVHARTELAQRREHLARVIDSSTESQALASLLAEVDAALARIDHGTFGTCETCHGTVEADRIAVDPLARTCLDCLSVAEQRALERDLDLAGRVQRTLLPPAAFQIDGWEGGYRYVPAGSASGDYVDLMPLDTGELLFFVGDVSGKGVAASLLMTHLHAILRSLTALRLPFGELMERANRIFYGSVGGTQHATLVCGRAAPGGDIELANAGHCPPILLRGDEAITLPPTSVPLGLFARAPFPTRRVKLGAGDVLLLYTDGVTEAFDAADCEYGMDRLMRAATSHRGAIGGLLDACVTDVDRHRDRASRRDDLTILALRRRY